MLAAPVAAPYAAPLQIGKRLGRMTRTLIILLLCLFATSLCAQDDDDLPRFEIKRGGGEESTHGSETSKYHETGIKEFGAFVEFMPSREGLVHISEMADFRVRSVDDICKMGDQMWVKVINVDDNGKVRLSRKAALADMDAAAKTT